MPQGRRYQVDEKEQQGSKPAKSFKEKSMRFASPLIRILEKALQFRRDLVEMEANQVKLKSMMSAEEQKVESFMQYELYLVVLIVVQSTSLVYYARNTHDEDFKAEGWNAIYWVWWSVISLVTYLGYKFKSPFFLKFGFHNQFILHILVFTDFSKKCYFRDLALVVQMSHPALITQFCLFFIPFCLVERAYIHIPISIVYMSIYSFSLFGAYYRQEVGHPDRFDFVWKNKMRPVVICTLQLLTSEYVVYLAILYIQTQLNKSISQLQLVKESLKVMVNQLNEAIIMRTEEGNFGFCNSLGQKILLPIAYENYPNDEKLEKFLNRLNSLEYLLQVSSNQGNVGELLEQQQKTLMNAPMLKLHIEAQGQKMNKNNGALTAEEQINLKLNDEKDDGDDLTAGQQATKQVYSLEDLFNLNAEDTLDNVYEVINSVESDDDKNTFKFVQIHRKEVKTEFSRHEVIQLIDVSQKILYEMANGEKRLFSLINATVSHEMRNPTNSINAQVQEQRVINGKLQDAIGSMTNQNTKETKKNLAKIFQRQNQSIQIQMSAVKLLNILVNDMLDYAQLSAGQFRKNFARFNLKESIGDIMDVMEYKAQELGIKLKRAYNFPKGQVNELNTISGEEEKIDVGFDNPRLQQILMNLLANAVKFTPFSGEVMITSSLISSEEDLAVKDPLFVDIISKSNGKKYLEVQVQDTGVGIKEEDQCKLFKLFGFLDTTKAVNSRGIGLGLHISKKICKMYDGDIICRSQFGVGSNFIFIIALCNPSDLSETEGPVKRIMNPLQKEYQKMNMFKKQEKEEVLPQDQGDGLEDLKKMDFFEELQKIQKEATDAKEEQIEADKAKAEAEAQLIAQKKAQRKIEKESKINKIHESQQSQRLREQDQRATQLTDNFQFESNRQDSCDRNEVKIKISMVSEHDETSDQGSQVSSGLNNEDDEAVFYDNSFQNCTQNNHLLEEENDERMLQDPKLLRIPTEKRILIVDDEPFNILGMQITMNQLNIKGLAKKVDRAYNGLEALNKVKDAFMTGSHVYGLILTDISMPVMDGFESAEEIRSFYRLQKAHQPMIVACTGHVEEEYIKRAWACEIDEVIPKPISAACLKEVFRQVF